MLDEDNEIVSFNNPLIGSQKASNNDMGAPWALITQVFNNHDIWYPWHLIFHYWGFFFNDYTTIINICNPQMMCCILSYYFITSW